KRVIAGQEARRARRKVRPSRLDRSIKVQRLPCVPQSENQPRTPPRVELGHETASASHDRVRPRRAKQPQHGQVYFVKEEIPAKEPAHKPGDGNYVKISAKFHGANRPRSLAVR